MLANHYIDELKWRIWNGEEGRKKEDRTERGLSNVIRTVRLFFEMQLDSDVKRKFSCEFFSPFFLISLRINHLCRDDIRSVNYIERITFFGDYLQKRRYTYILYEDTPL